MAESLLLQKCKRTVCIYILNIYMSMISSQRHMLTHMIIYIFTITFSYDNIFIYFIYKKNDHTPSRQKKNFFMKRVYLSLGRGTEVFCVCVIKKEKFTQNELYMHMTFFKLKNTTERYCTLFSFEVGMINLKCFYIII